MPLRAASLPVPLGLFRPAIPRTTWGPVPVRCMRNTTTVWVIMVRMALRRLTTYFIVVCHRRVCAVGGEVMRRIHITGVAGMGRSGMTPTGIRTTAPRW